MKKFNKLVSVAIASAMALSMVACGSQNSGSSDTFRIGGIGPTTGGAAIYGLDRFSENMWAELETQIPVVQVQEKQEFKRKKPKLQQYQTMRIDDPWL